MLETSPTSRWFAGVKRTFSGEGTAQSQRFLASFGFIGGLIGVAWMVLYVATGYPWPFIACNVPVTIAGLSMPWVVRLGLKQSTLATAAAFLVQAAIVVPTIYTGGIHSFNAVWLFVVPYVAVIGGARASWPYLMATTALSLVGMAGLSATGSLPEPYLPYPIVQPLFSWLSAVVLMTGGILFHHRIVQGAIAQERAFNTALKQEVDQHRQTQTDLKTTQRDLIAAARLAGMAEVANGVLHNVGNGLNTVNVAVALLAERSNPLPSARLCELADLLDSPEAPHAAVGQYLRRLAAVGTEQHNQYQQDVGRLRQQVEHVNTIVQAQQQTARHGGLIDDIEVSELLDNTLLLAESRLQGVAVTVDANRDVVLASDRHKTMLVMLNLINNAVDAMTACPSPTLHIAIHPNSHTLVIRVTDNGTGVPKNDLERIFQHGFTTKQNGHGFGLHSSALAAREMGGQLQASSEGPGRGATFTFTLPLSPATSQGIATSHARAS